tara:strand:+ start:142 stop:288 length:147 start_codon:yes stop_codon:yes gene_type:complete
MSDESGEESESMPGLVEATPEPEGEQFILEWAIVNLKFLRGELVVSAC